MKKVQIKITIEGDGQTKIIECDQYFLEATKNEDGMVHLSNYGGLEMAALSIYCSETARGNAAAMIKLEEIRNNDQQRG